MTNPDTPIFGRLYDEQLADFPLPSSAAGLDPATTMLPAASGPIRYGDVTDWAGPPPDPPAATAGEQDHANPWFYAGVPAPPPVNP